MQTENIFVAIFAQNFLDGRSTDIKVFKTKFDALFWILSYLESSRRIIFDVMNKFTPIENISKQVKDILEQNIDLEDQHALQKYICKQNIVCFNDNYYEFDEEMHIHVGFNCRIYNLKKFLEVGEICITDY